jgi:hypothetical protein
MAPYASSHATRDTRRTRMPTPMCPAPLLAAPSQIEQPDQQWRVLEESRAATPGSGG